MRAFILLAVTIGLALAQYQPQTVTVTYLSPSVTVTGALAPTTANPYITNEYAIWVPANVSSINVTVANTSPSSCYYIYDLYRTDGAACNDDAFSSSNFYCGNVQYDTTTYGDSSNRMFYPGNDYDLTEFKVNDYFYIGVSQSSTSSTGCTYSLRVDFTYCASNLVAAYDYSSDINYCISYDTVNNNAPTTFNVVNNGAGYYHAWIMDVLPETGMITVFLNLTSTSPTMYGNQYSGRGYSGDYKCSGYASSSAGDYYTGTINCYVPRTGRFVWTIKTDTEFNGTISFAPTVCGGTGMGGYACGYPEMALNMTQLASTGLNISMPYNSTGQLSYYQYIYYVDVANGTTPADFFFYIYGSSSGELVVRPNGYPEYNSYGYEDSSEYQSISSYPGYTYWALTSFDYVFAGRYFFTVFCQSSNGCNFFISSFDPSKTSTTGASLTTGSTTGSTTGITTGSTTAMNTTLTTGITTGITTAMNTTLTTGSTTRANTTLTTGITTRANTTLTTGSTTMAKTTGTTTAPVMTTGSTSGFEMIIPSVALLFIASLF